MSPHSVPTLSNSATGLWVTGVAKQQLSQWEKTTPHGTHPRAHNPDWLFQTCMGHTPREEQKQADSSSVFSLVKLWCSQASLFLSPAHGNLTRGSPVPCKVPSDAPTHRSASRQTLQNTNTWLLYSHLSRPA